jgi:hypothetical protein
MSGFDISKESVKGYAKVSEGVYMTSEEDFHPARQASLAILNNRAFFFEVTNKDGKKHLLMSGIPGKSEIPKAQQIEKDTGLKITLIVTSGDFHHMSMEFW